MTEDGPSGAAAGDGRGWVLTPTQQVAVERELGRHGTVGVGHKCSEQDYDGAHEAVLYDVQRGTPLGNPYPIGVGRERAERQVVVAAYGALVAAGRSGGACAAARGGARDLVVRQG